LAHDDDEESFEPANDHDSSGDNNFHYGYDSNEADVVVADEDASTAGVYDSNEDYEAGNAIDDGKMNEDDNDEAGNAIDDGKMNEDDVDGMNEGTDNKNVYQGYRDNANPPTPEQEMGAKHGGRASKCNFYATLEMKTRTNGGGMTLGKAPMVEQ
jgi:hypothetical protein